MSLQPDLRVVGSGPAALAFALFAIRQGFEARRIRLERFDAPIPPALAARQLAMSAGSWQLLGRIADPPRAAPIQTVDVSILGHPGRTRITAASMRVPALGYVSRYSELLSVLQRAAALAGLRSEPPGVDTEVLDRDGNVLIAAVPTVTVHAEGDTGEDASRREFGQSALLAEVEVAPSHGNEAFECFTANGPLALLPLPEPRRYSLVWCDQHEASQRRATLEPHNLAGELQSAFGWALGRLSIASPAVVVPMVRRTRRKLIGASEAWIGNAAQALHPVGGQGLNLGLRDAFLLAKALGDAQAAGTSVEAALERYARSRRQDRSTTVAVTDTLARAFGFRALRPLQSMALAALDTLPAARGGLARQFMFGMRG